MARSIHCRPAEQHQARIARRSQRDRIAGTKHQQTAGGKAVARDIDLAGNQVDRALFGAGVDRQRSSGGKRDVGK